MKPEDIYRGDRCWFLSLAQVDEDGTNATVISVVHYTTPDQYEIKVRVDNGAEIFATPGVDLAWSKPNMNSTKKAPPKTPVTKWLNVYQSKDTPAKFPGARFFDTEAEALSKKNERCIATVSVTWKE